MIFSHYFLFLSALLHIPSMGFCDIFNKLSLEEKQEIAQECGWSNTGNARTRQLNTSQLRGKGHRIINGHDAQQDRFPFIVAIEEAIPDRDENINCGGVLISRRHILTARHCFLQQKLEDMQFLVGGVCPHKTGPCTEVDMEMRSHRGFVAYDGASQASDYFTKELALIELVNPIEIKHNLSFVCLAHQDASYQSDNAITMGWGLTTRPYGESSARLKYLEKMKFLSKQEAKDGESNAAAKEAIDNDFLLAMVSTDNPQNTPFIHDSGGPVVYKNERNNFELLAIIYGDAGPYKNGRAEYVLSVKRFLNDICYYLDLCTPGADPSQPFLTLKPYP